MGCDLHNTRLQRKIVADKITFWEHRLYNQP